MQTTKARRGSSDVPQRVSPRDARQLKTTGLESNSASSSSPASRMSKERNPKVFERRSSRSPVSYEKQRPSKISELESHISQLQEDLKKAKDQLGLSELWKKQSQQNAEYTKKELLAMSAKLEQSQQQLQELSAFDKTYHTELHKTAQEQEKEFRSELETLQIELSVDPTLNSVESEIQQPEMEAEPEATQIKDMNMSNTELESLKINMVETLSLVANMKNQILSCKESEARAQALVNETLLQLEGAKKTIEELRLDDIKATEAYNSVSSELDQSRARMSSLEELVSKMEADPTYSTNSLSQSPSGASYIEHEIGGSTVTQEPYELELELHALKSEVQNLISALEIAETNYQEERLLSAVQKSSMQEFLEQSKAMLSLKEGEFEAELKKIKADMEEFKTNLMDKEIELQGICEENDELNSKLEKSQSYQRENALTKEVKSLNEHVAETKANLMDKETELRNISEEIQMLKREIKERENNKSQINDEAVTKLEAAKNAEKEALTKLGLVMEDADRTTKRAMKAAEQLQAAQVENSEMEAELRRLKVQSDQWRKAAEAAAAMLSSGNNGNFIERTGSLDNYNSANRKTDRPYSVDGNDDLLKKKNGNMLKKIGVLWKKPHK